MENFNIFEMLYETKKLDSKKPLRVIEFFAGYGSQTLALKYLGVKYEHWKICEWAVPSIIAYASLHRNELEEYGNNFCGDLSKEQIASELFSMGVSVDYNKPATFEQLKRMPEEKLRLCFNSIMWSNNLVDISRVHGKDLHIEREREHLLTYSFPCQDLSLAGKCAGMEKGSGTRSGLLWEVERILSECENKPQILLMENVTQVHCAGNEEHFREWMLRLEEMGYQNYWKDLSATEFKIPQTRNRTFMVSILGNYNYTFPKKTKLELRLKDLLEPDGTIDEKYYISDKMITGMLNTNFESYKLENKLLELDGVANTIIARFEGTPQLVNDKPKLKIKNATKKGYLEAHEGDGIDISRRMESHRGTVQKGMAQTITTAGGENVGVVIKDNSNNKNDNILKKELCNKLIEDGLVEEYDVVKHSYTSQIMDGNKKCVEKSDGVMITLTTRGDCLGVVVKDKEDFNYSEKSLNKIKKNIVDENDVSGSLTATGMQSLNHDGCQLVSLKRGYSIEAKEEKGETNKVDYIGNYSKSNFNQTSVVGKNGVVPTVTENHGQVKSICESELLGGFGEKYSNGGTQLKFQNRVYNSENSSPSVTTSFNPNYKIGLRIRKLTPKECFRLMGLKDEDIDLVMENQTISRSYHLAGDSIVTTCMMAIFGKLFDIDWTKHFNPEEWWKNG